MLPAAVTDPSFKPCKICGSKADLYGVVDFHKSCLEQKGYKLNLSGIPIYYRRCAQCSFVFTDAFDNWSHQDFERRIYNADYAKVDPEYLDSRPEKNAEFINLAFGAGKTGLRVLDYGGGNGALADTLRRDGYTADSFDPFSQHNVRPTGKANLLTAFEVMEHVPEPHRTVDDMLSLLEPDGIVLFSTLLQPPDFDQIGLNWWYIGPRNGHISIYSPLTLEHLFKPKGLSMVSLNGGMHLACRNMAAAFDTGPMRFLTSVNSAVSAA